MTPTDTMTPIRPTPDNPTDPCTCGHSRRNHGQDNGHAVCFVCTHPRGGCRGFTHEPPDSTAGQRDAYLAGFHAGADWAAWDGDSAPYDRHDAAVAQYEQWAEGDAEPC